MTVQRQPTPLRAEPDRVERLAFSAAEAAEAMGVDRGTVYAWIKAGQLRVFHAGRNMRISRAALEEFIAARELEEGFR
jgi:excisionase family DNA binding protein